MEEEKNLQIVEGGAPTSELAPLDLIRTETVFSKYPIHNLAKKGSINIQITRTTEQGKIDFLWKVSASRDYGEPRQLAYKLDTIIINHRIDEAGRPLPERIKIGSLNEICQELGIIGHAGKNTRDIRQALLQNAGAFITAKLSFKGNDGTQRYLDANFTRYTVIFTGEKFADGRKADAVYIELHPRYREALNSTPVRPLDRAYMKELPPTAQRFYEIVSYKIFAALINGYPTASLLYSDYCTSSAQRRHFDRQRAQEQMVKVHRPHIAAKYISKIRYEVITDAAGNFDMEMQYTPGPKAITFYNATFKGKVKNLPIPTETGESIPHRRNGPRQRRLKLEPASPEPTVQQPTAAVPAVAPIEPDPNLIAVFHDYGITEKKTRDLLANLKPGQTHDKVLAQLELAHDTFHKTPGKFDSYTGFLVSFVRDDTPIPANFETKAQRKSREAEKRRQAEEDLARMELEQEYEWYRNEQVQRYIDSHPDEFAALVKTKWAEQRQQYQRLSPQMIDDFAQTAAKGAVRESGQVPMMTLEEFKASRGQGSAAPAEPVADLVSAATALEESPATEGIPPIPEAMPANGPFSRATDQLPADGRGAAAPELLPPPALSNPIAEHGAPEQANPIAEPNGTEVPPQLAASEPAILAETAAAETAGNELVSDPREPAQPEPDQNAGGPDLHPYLL